MDFTPDGTQVWVTNPSSNQATVFDARGRELLASLTLAKSPSGVYISADGRHAFITNAIANELTSIDVATRKILSTMPIGTDPDGVAWSAR
jgi:YVTN family beta-propeller protein